MLAILLHKFGSVVVEDSKEQKGLHQTESDRKGKQKPPEIITVKVLWCSVWNVSKRIIILTFAYWFAIGSKTNLEGTGIAMKKEIIIPEVIRI